MPLTEFDEKLHKKTVYNEDYEDGHKNGVCEGFDKVREDYIIHSIDMLRSMGISDDRIVCLIAENYIYQKNI